MQTQTIRFNLSQTKLPPILMRSEEKGREIYFEILDEEGDDIDVQEYAIKFMLLKPDGNVVYADIVNSILTQTEQMTTSKGKGYYAIRIMDTDTLIYSGQGALLVDDHIIDDETLNSISEVDGLVFPDDFLTTAEHFAQIADNRINTEETWSSEKISETILGVPEILISDGSTAEDKTWSGYYLAEELQYKAEIDDNAQTTQSTWSSSKIASEISSASPEHVYSSTPQIVGKWITGENVLEVTHDFGSAGLSIIAGQWVSYNNRVVPAGAKIISCQGVTLSNNFGWTCSNLMSYQPAADNSSISFYGPQPNGFWMRYAIIQYYIPA